MEVLINEWNGLFSRCRSWRLSPNYFKGKECLEKADVVICDYLADKRLMAFAKDDVEYIYVGKKAGNHAMRQEDISQLIADKAKEGKCVVRLKGGDPFVFGRGGEEAEVLKKK